MFVSCELLRISISIRCLFGNSLFRLEAVSEESGRFRNALQGVSFENLCVKIVSVIFFRMFPRCSRYVKLG